MVDSGRAKAGTRAKKPGVVKLSLLGASLPWAVASLKAKSSSGLLERAELYRKFF